MGGVQPPGGSGANGKINILKSTSCIKIRFLKKEQNIYFSEQASPSCQVQQLLLDSFPEEEHSSEKKVEVEEKEEEEVLSLGRHLPDSQKMEETQHLRPTFHS